MLVIELFKLYDSLDFTDKQVLTISRKLLLKWAPSVVQFNFLPYVQIASIFGYSTDIPIMLLKLE